MKKTTRCGPEKVISGAWVLFFAVSKVKNNLLHSRQSYSSWVLTGCQKKRRGKKNILHCAVQNWTIDLFPCSFIFFVIQTNPVLRVRADECLLNHFKEKQHQHSESYDCVSQAMCSHNSFNPTKQSNSKVWAANSYLLPVLLCCLWWIDLRLCLCSPVCCPPSSLLQRKWSKNCCWMMYTHPYRNYLQA